MSRMTKTHFIAEGVLSMAAIIAIVTLFDWLLGLRVSFPSPGAIFGASLYGIIHFRRYREHTK